MKKNGTYQEELPCGGALLVTQSGWQIRYYYPGPDLRYTPEFIYVPGGLIDKYIDAYKENFLKFKRMRDELPSGAEYFEAGKRGMTIYVSLAINGVCLQSDFMPVNSEIKLKRLLDGYTYAKQRAIHLQSVLATL